MKKSVLFPIALILFAFGPIIAALPFFEAVGGIVGRAAVSRGFTLADPRVRETIGNVIYLVGSKAASGITPGTQTNLLKVFGAAALLYGFPPVAGLEIDQNGNARMTGSAGSAGSIATGDALFTINSGEITTNFANAAATLSAYPFSCAPHYPENCKFIPGQPQIYRNAQDEITQIAVFFDVHRENGVSIGAEVAAAYPAGTATQNYDCGAYNSNGCIAAPPGDFKAPVEFYDSLTPAQKALPVDPAFLADLINDNWQEISQQPNFAGIPASASSPITPADVQNFYDQNGAVTLDNISKPVDVSADPNGNPVINTSPGSVSGENTQTSPNSDKEPLNLGPDPNIGAPAIENITAGSILSPILNLLPGFKNFQLIEPHNTSCEPIHINVWFADVSTDSHCQIFDYISPTLQVVMTIFWTGLGIFIVLGA